jgi:Tfp pilus assembly protein PilF
LGLITKAIEKVEDKENPPVQPETPPRSKGKKRFSILAAVLLLVGASLGLGYLFLLQPGSEAPPQVARRSISAKNKPPKPINGQSQQTKAADKAEAKPSKKESASGESPEKSVPSRKPTKEGGAAAEQKEKTPEAAALAPVAATEGQTFKAEEELQTKEPGILQSMAPSVSSVPEIETLIESPPSEDKNEASFEAIPDNAASLGEQEEPTEQLALSQGEGPGGSLAQEKLTVRERSESRAERYYKKGVSYQQKGESARAIEAYRKALAYCPDHVEAHINLAIAYLQTGRLKEAEQELIYVYALKPTNCQILFNFGLLLFQTREYASAETKLKKLLQLDPFHLEANLLLSSVYEEKGRVGKTLEYCLRAYEINSADPQVLYRLGRAWDLAAETAKAIQYYRLFLGTDSEKSNGLRQAVRDRVDYLVSRKEEK